jgi:hypothetical protein
VVDLPPPARKIYDQMENLMLAQVNSKTVVAANAAAVTGKCRQVAGGGVYSGLESGGWERIHEAKLDAVSEVVEGLQGEPVIVVYEFDHERERLQERFPSAPHIGGGVTANRFREIESAWNKGQTPVLLVQPASAAWGLNLQAGGSQMVFFSITWNLDHYSQIIGRIYRQGQEKRVFIHHIVAKKTVDEVILKMLAKKDKTQKALLDALKDYTESRV